MEDVGAVYTFIWNCRPKPERQDVGVAFATRNDIVDRLPCLPQGINDRLMSLRLPFRGGKFVTIDWFDDNDAAISDLLAEKNCLHKAYIDHLTNDNRDAFYRSRRLVQQRPRRGDPRTRDRDEWKNIFSAIKAVYGPLVKGTAPLSADGRTLLTELTQILQRWAEHFRGILNRPSTISDAAIARLPQVETNADLDFPPPLHETTKPVQQLPSRKAPGSDAIPAEICKHGDPKLMAQLTVLFQELWRQEVQHNFREVPIIHRCKRKGNRQLCDNHRGGSLLNIAGLIFARILVNHRNNHLEQGLQPEC
nr:unnamed protein product [Spirometra erinaceieuropaei]